MESSSETAARERMVATQMVVRGIRDERVLAALRAVPRHLFVPERERAEAYFDHPLPIGHGQTISQPYIVALMTELALPPPEGVVLEIGTGSGYQTAVLAQLAREVYSVEIFAPLAEQAARMLAESGFTNVHLRTGDGHAGWPEAAPFDAIVLTAAPDRVPRELLEQLRVAGKLVAPEGGEGVQILKVYTQTGHGCTVREILPVRFVPLLRQTPGTGSIGPS